MTLRTMQIYSRMLIFCVLFLNRCNNSQVGEAVVVDCKSSDTAETAEKSVLTLEPNQPVKDYFPTKSYGSNKNIRYRSFQSSWYAEWKWISYDEQKDAVFCHPCRMVHCLKLKMMNKSAELSFTDTGFSNWKDARKRFAVHENSGSHQEACDKWRSHINKEPSVASQLSAQHLQQQAEARQAMLRIIQNLVFLAAQGLPLRGHTDVNSNFYQLNELRRSDCVELDAWLKRQSRISYTSHDIQNELIEILAHTVIRSIAQSVKEAKFFGLIADETTDCSRRQQVSIVLRWVDAELEVHEDFIGFVELPEDANAQTLTTILEDCMLRLGLEVRYMHAACYY